MITDKSTREEVLAEARRDGLATIRDLISLRLHFTKEILLAAVTQNYEAINLVPQALEDEDIAIAVVSQCGQYLRNLPVRFQTNEKVVLAAVTNDPEAIVRAKLLTKKNSTCCSRPRYKYVPICRCI